MLDELSRLTEGLTKGTARRLQRRLRGAVLQAIAGLLLLLALLLACAAAGIWLAARYGAVAALLMLAGALVGLALLILGSVRQNARTEARIEAAEAEGRKALLLSGLALLPRLGSASTLALIAALGLVFGLSIPGGGDAPENDES